MPDYDAMPLPGAGGEFFSELFAKNEEVESEKYDKALADWNMTRAYIETFSTPAGQAVFQDLWEQLVPKVQFDPRVENPEVMGFFNSGAASVILEIERRMKRIGEDPPEQPGESIDLG